MHRKVRHAAAALQYPKVGIFTPSLSRYILYMVAAARNQVDKFANPEHRRCAYYDEQPVGHAEGHDAEKRPSTLHYGDLAEDDYQRDEQKSLASFKMESRTPAGKRPGVEEVPELQEHEYGEKQAQLVGRQLLSHCTSILADNVKTLWSTEYIKQRGDNVSVEIPQQSQQHNEESSPCRKDELHIDRAMIKSERLRGLASITLRDGGSDARATAAKVSIIRLTHSIWVTVSGDCIPMNAPTSTIRLATTLTVIWNRMKRWMF